MTRTSPDWLDEPATVLIRGAVLLDCTGADPTPGLDVLLRGGRIVGIGSPTRPFSDEDVLLLDGSGCTLMPGLSDAHVHLGSIGESGDHGTDEWSSYVLGVARAITELVAEGFTTVRDAGGLEPSFARAVARREISGPRILASGSQLTNTGGHGDVRLPYRATSPVATIPGLIAANEIVDGRDAMTKAAREQLRRGASQVKVFASGGVISISGLGEQHDLAEVEFSSTEMAAAVEVAADHGTYVMAHCQTPRAVNRAIDAGVRSIEHGVMLDEQSANRIAAAGAYLVPTLSVYHHLGGQSEPQLEAIKERYRQSVLMAHEAGVALGSGSDGWGGQHPYRGRELALKADVVGSLNAILSATNVNAKLFGLSDELGTVEVGKRADVILVEGNPLDDISVLGDPDRIKVVIKDGMVQKLAPDRLTATGNARKLLHETAASIDR